MNKDTAGGNDMADVPASDSGPDIDLAEMIESLRRELQISLERGEDQRVVFDVEKVELELKVAVTRKRGGEGGVAFWVVKAGASLESGRDMTHTFKLTLVPVFSDSGKRLKVRAITSEGPSRD